MLARVEVVRSAVGWVHALVRRLELNLRSIRRESSNCSRAEPETASYSTVRGEQVDCSKVVVPRDDCSPENHATPPD